MAGDKKIVDVKFWEDKLVMDKMTNEERYFFLYLLTNSKHKLCGVYRLPLREIKLVANLDNAKEILKRFEEEYEIVAYNYDTEEVAIFNHLKYSIVKGGKPISDQITKELERVEDGGLLLAVYNHMLNYWNRSFKKVNQIIRDRFKEELEKRHLLNNDYVDDYVNDNDYVNDYDYDDSCSNQKKPTNKQENNEPKNVDEFLSQPEFNPK